MSSPDDGAPADDTAADEAAVPTDDTAVEAGAAAPEPADPTSPASGDERRLALLDAFKDGLGDAVVGAHIRDGDDLWVRVTNEAWRDAGLLARNRLRMGYFVFLSAIDWLPSPYGRSEDSPFDEPAAGEAAPIEHGFAGGDTRLQVFARVYSIADKIGLNLKADVADDDPAIATWLPVYAGANWHEREAHEMFGIRFDGHPHLAHLYLPGGFEGHPLRKDFPLLARQVKPWPGIVDVEPMPDDGEADEAAVAEEAGA